MKEPKNPGIDGICPLSELPCPNGSEASLECRLTVNSNFDPVASFHDLCILECAREQAEKARNRMASDSF